jgi:5-methylthioribose kinase
VAGPLDDLIGELRTLRLGLCHGDFSPKNLLIHPPPAAGPFTLVDYETAHYGDPAMDLGFFLSHLILKGLKNLPQRAGYFLLTRVFWKAYEAVIRFQPVEAIKPRAIRHFAACALARVDGASPVDYLPGPAHQDAVRQFAGRLLQHPVRRWREALHAVETACQPLEE